MGWRVWREPPAFWKGRQASSPGAGVGVMEAESRIEAQGSVAVFCIRSLCRGSGSRSARARYCHIWTQKGGLGEDTRIAPSAGHLYEISTVLTPYIPLSFLSGGGPLHAQLSPKHCEDGKHLLCEICQNDLHLGVCF